MGPTHVKQCLQVEPVHVLEGRSRPPMTWKGG